MILIHKTFVFKFKTFIFKFKIIQFVQVSTIEQGLNTKVDDEQDTVGLSDSVLARRWMQNEKDRNRKSQFVWEYNIVITKMHNNKSKCFPATQCSKDNTSK